MKTISFVMTGPPSVEAGAFVKIVDDEGNPVDVGWWEHDGQYHRYTMPVELVPRLVLPAGRIAEPYGDDPTIQAIYKRERDRALHEPIDFSRAEAGSRVLQETIAESDAIAARRRRKEQVASAQKKVLGASAAPAEAPAHWETCPSCRNKFDPAKDELMACGQCGEDRSTACCMPNPTQPCLDCQAQKPDPDEADATFAAPPGDALFDGKFRGKDGGVSEADDEEDQ